MENNKKYDIPTNEAFDARILKRTSQWLFWRILEYLY